MIKKYLANLHACEDAIKWVGDRTSFSAAWKACPRGDWLLWFSANIDIDQKVIVQAACELVKALALPVYKKHCPKDRRPAADAAADAAYAAAYAAADATACAAADTATWSKTRKAALLQTANIVRKHITWATVKEAMKVEKKA